MNPEVPIEGDDYSGPGSTDGQPIRYVPRRFPANDHAAIEASLGRGKYAEILYEAGYKSARHWCDKKARTHGLTRMAVFEHYLERLSRGGWGRFSFIQADEAGGCADIRLDYSDFILAQGEICAAKTCYIFAGWFAGAMDWVGEQTRDKGGTPLRTLCCEARCGAEGYDHCVFAVRPKAMSAV